jgi:hypothetical protein
MRISVLGLCFLVVAAMACSTSSPENECSSDECLKQRAYDSVIEVHDIIMPKLSYISELKGKIEERMNGEQDTVKLAAWQRQMEELDAADEAMWVWMRNFKSDLEEVPIDEALEYLASEKKKVDTMAQQVSIALESAETSLK